MTVRRLFAWMLLLALVAMAVRPTIDPDMWWHLRTGEFIVESGIPRQDVFSFTVPERIWVTHEWLSQVIMWGLYLLGGLPALIIGFAAIGATTHWLVYMASDGRPYIAGFLTLLGALSASIVWGARPQLFNLLLAALVVLVVEKWRLGQWPPYLLWLMLPLVALWANLHSGYLVGVAILGTYVAGEAGRRWLFRDERALTKQQTLTLATVTVGSFVASSLNPNGPELWIYPFETLGSNAMQTYIQEWHSPNFHVPIFWSFGVMLALGLVGFVHSREPATLTELLLFLGSGAAGLQSARNIPFFAIVATPILARHWVSLARSQRACAWLVDARPRRLSRGLHLINWALALLVLLGTGAWAWQKIAANETEIARRYPVAAVDFLEAEGLASARLFNSYGWGGYLIWRGIPVFVDGRADVYGDAFLHAYVDTAELAPTWRGPLDDHDVDVVLMESDAPLSTLLVSTRDWREAYVDDVARIFVRDER